MLGKHCNFNVIFCFLFYLLEENNFTSANLSHNRLAANAAIVSHVYRRRKKEFDERSISAMRLSLPIKVLVLSKFQRSPDLGNNVLNHIVVLPLEAETKLEIYKNLHPKPLK